MLFRSDLVGDAREFAHRNPGLFIAGGVAAGFLLARFVKASARRAEPAAEFPDDDAPTLTDEVDEVIVEVDEEIVLRPGA